MFDTNEQKYAEYTVITDLHTLLANRFNPKISGSVLTHIKKPYFMYMIFFISDPLKSGHHTLHNLIYTFLPCRENLH